MILHSALVRRRSQQDNIIYNRIVVFLIFCTQINDFLVYFEATFEAQLFPELSVGIRKSPEARPEARLSRKKPEAFRLMKNLEAFWSWLIMINHFCLYNQWNTMIFLFLSALPCFRKTRKQVVFHWFYRQNSSSCKVIVNELDLLRWDADLLR